LSFNEAVLLVFFSIQINHILFFDFLTFKHKLLEFSFQTEEGAEAVTFFYLDIFL
jgi:hypothetical protein